MRRKHDYEDDFDDDNENEGPEDEDLEPKDDE